MTNTANAAPAAESLTLREDDSGAAYVEFLISFIPVFIMFLGMLQGALMYGANLVVTHAANRAARAAIVVLPDVEDEYDGEQQNRVDFTASSSSDDSITSFLEEAGGGSYSAPFTAAGSRGSKRLNAIRAAASMPLLSISPSFDQLTGDPEVYKAVGGRPAERAIVGATLYNRTAVSVTFPTTPGATTYKTSFNPHEDVTVRVTYMFHCGVPLANRFMCDDYLALRTGIPAEAAGDLARLVASGNFTLRELQEHVRRVRQTSDRLNAAQPGMDELQSAQTPWLGFLTVLTGSRFHILRAEATLRNHGASYSY